MDEWIENLKKIAKEEVANNPDKAFALMYQEHLRAIATALQAETAGEAVQQLLPLHVEMLAHVDRLQRELRLRLEVLEYVVGVDHSRDLEALHFPGSGEDIDRSPNFRSHEGRIHSLEQKI